MASSQGGHVTVRDVARHADVSKATAARVLGGYGPVSDVVRDAVLSSARKLGYRANTLARSMATGRTRTVGVVVSDIENPFFGRAVRGITDAMSAAGLDVIIANTDENLEVERGLIDVLRGKQVDGLIISPANSTDVRHLIEIDDIPVVLIDRHAGPESTFDSVVADNKGGGVLLGKKLRSAGHRQVAFLTSANPVGWKLGDVLPQSSVAERIEGLALGLGIEGALSVHPAATDAAHVLAILDELLSAKAAPTAIVASDSVIALHLFNALRDRNVTVGHELSLCSFDNAEWTAVTRPAVTVIDQPVHNVGQQAAALLLARIAGDTSQTRAVVLPVVLVDRESIAPAPQMGSTSP